MISTICLVVALVLFILAAMNVPYPRVNFISAGLAFWVISILVGRF